MPSKTLQIKLPFGNTILLAAALLLIIGALSEFVARQYFSQVNSEHALEQSLGTPSVYLDRAILKAENYASSGAPIDCIFIGSSMVLTGFDETEFHEAYAKSTGRDLTCLNFGIPALVTDSASFVGQAIAMKFQPELVIFGTAARDYSDKIKKSSIPTTSDFANDPWIRYQLGEFSIEGWLITNSYAYRYALAIGKKIEEFGLGGRVSARTMNFDLTKPPSRTERPNYYGILDDYEISGDSATALDSLLDITQLGIDIVVVEIPVHETYLSFFENGDQDQRVFLDFVATQSADRGVAFLISSNEISVPNEGWLNRNHLNPTGAAQFSQWLGFRLGGLVSQGVINEHGQ